MSTGLQRTGLSAAGRSRRLPVDRRARMPLHALPAQALPHAPALPAHAPALPAHAQGLAAQALAALTACGALVLLAQGHAMSWLAGAVAGSAGAACAGPVTAVFSQADEPAPERVARKMPRPEPAPELTVAPELPASSPASALAAPPMPSLPDPGPKSSPPDPADESRGPDSAGPERSEAERRTERELAALDDAGWRFVHDVAAPVGNFDHIAVGPAGVILIESREPAGVVTIEGGTPVVSAGPGTTGSGPGTDELHNLRPRTLADAAALREELRRLAGRRVWVQSMVVFWSEFPAGCVIDGRIVFIHGSRLTRWLSRRPPQLTATEIGTVYEIVRALPGATIAEPAPAATVTPLRVVA